MMPGMPMPPGPHMMPNGQPMGGGAANPYMAHQPPKEPIQEAGENAITQLLQMATSNPQLLMGLSMAGAAREISQLTGLSRRRGGGTAGQGRPAGAQPSAGGMLGGAMGDLDRLVQLQQMMGGGEPMPGGMPMPGGPPMGGPPGLPPGMPPGMPMPGPGGPPMPPGMPGGGMPGMPGGLPPQFAGLV